MNGIYMPRPLYTCAKPNFIDYDVILSGESFKFFSLIYCLLLVITCSSPGSSTLSSNTSRLTLSIRRVDGEINVLLGCGTNIEGRNVDKLSSNADMTLTDQNTGMVDGLSKTLLVNLGLKASLQKLLGGKLKDRIKIKLIISKKSVTGHTTKESSSLENTLRILGVKGKKNTSSLTKLSESKLNTPDLTLTPKSVLSDKLELSVKTFLLVRTTRSLICFAVVTEHCVGRHG
jgi:hypothetical protein